MSIPYKVLKKLCNTKLKLSEVNPHLICVLCGGYYIDATTIVECLHSFCRSCIVKHLEGSKYCPICEVQVHKTKPLANIRADKTLQDLVYRLVPGLYKNEMESRRMFYLERPHYIKPEDSEAVGEVSGEPRIYVNGENITFALIYHDGQSPVPVARMYRELKFLQCEVRYFRCPPAVSIKHLKKLLRAKYDLRGSLYRVDIFFKEYLLKDMYTLLDIAYIYLWDTDDDLILTFKAYRRPVCRRRRRYLGGLNDLPPLYTPQSILQSRLGNLSSSMLEDIPEGKRHLRSDIEKKRKEIELKAEEERRLSERELRSHDEKKKDKDKDKDKEKNKEKLDKTKEKNKKEKNKKKDKEEKKKDDEDNEGKKKDGKDKEAKKKDDEDKECKMKDDTDKEAKKKDDKDKGTKKKDGKDKEAKKKDDREMEEVKKDDKDKEGKKKDDEDKEGKKKDGNVGEAKKNEAKEEKKKKKEKEGRCQEEKREDKDDEEDKDDKGMDKSDKIKDKDDKGKDKDDKVQDKDERGKDKNDKVQDKDAKEVKNGVMEPKKGPGRKRKREGGEGDEKRRRETRENHVDKGEREESKENGCETTASEEQTTTAVPEPAPTSNSTQTLTGATNSNSPSAADSSQTSTPVAEESTSNSATDSAQAPAPDAVQDSTTASESRSEPNSSTAMETEQKAEEISVKKEELPDSFEVAQNNYTPPKELEFKEVQIEISESGIWRISRVVEKPGDIVKTVEENPDGEATRRSSIPGTSCQSEGSGTGEMGKKPFPKDEGFPKEPKGKVGRPPNKRYKTIRRAPVVWHPYISKEKLRSTFVRNPEESSRPAKFFKLRNKSRLLENTLSDVKPVVKEYSPARGDEEEMLQHEIEKEEVKVEPEEAQVTTRDEIEEKKMEEEKRRFEEDRRQNEEEERNRFEEDSKPVTTSANICPTVEGDPNTFVSFDENNSMGVGDGDGTPDLSNNPKSDSTTSGPVDKEDKSSFLGGGSVSDLPTELKGDEKTFGSLDEEDKYSTTVGCNALDLPGQGDEPLDKEDKYSTITSGSAPDLTSNLQGVPTTLELNAKESTLTMVDTSGRDLPNSLEMKTFEQSSSSMVAGSAPDHPMNLKMDLNTFAQYDTVQEKCPSIIVASAPNLMAGQFIPNSNHFLLSNLTYPSTSGNYSTLVEPKLDQSVLGNVMPGMSEVGVTGLGVGGGIGGPMSNGVSYSPMCYVDQYRLVYPYQTYPVTETTISHMPALGKTGGFDQISGSQMMTIPQTADISSTPQQNLEGTSLAWANPINDGGNKCQKKKVSVKKVLEKKVAEKKVSVKKVAEKKVAEKKLSQKKLSEKKVSQKKVSEKKVAEKKVVEKKVPEKKVVRFLPPTPEELERKRRRKEFEDEVKRLLKLRAPPAKETKTKVVVDPKREQDRNEDDEKIFVPAKRLGDEEGSQEKEKMKDDKTEMEEKVGVA